MQVLEKGSVLWRSRRTGAAWALALGIAGAIATAVLMPPAAPRGLAGTAGAMAGLVVVGAAFALQCRTAVELSPRGLRWRQHGLFGVREQLAPRAAVVGVRVRAELALVADAADGRQRRFYQAELLLSGDGLPDAVPLLRTPDELRARANAEQAATAAEVPFVDAVGDDVMVRPAGALDRRPAQRRALPPQVPTGIAVDGVGAGAAASTTGVLPRDRRGLVVALPLLLLPGAALGAGLVLAMAPRSLLPIALPLVLGADALVLLLVLWALRCRTSVRVADGRLCAQMSLLGVPLRTRCVPVDAVEQVRVQAGIAAAGQRGVAVVTDRRILVLGRGLEAAACRWLAAWLEQQLWPDLPVGGAVAAPAPVAAAISAAAASSAAP